LPQTGDFSRDILQHHIDLIGGATTLQPYLSVVEVAGYQLDIPLKSISAHFFPKSFAQNDFALVAIVASTVEIRVSTTLAWAVIQPVTPWKRVSVATSYDASFA
jgi:hypothetical protein